MITNSNITHTELLIRLHYDSATGIFTHKKGGCGVTLGMIAGGQDPGHKYIRIKLDGKLYLAHRLAWFYVHGEWPTDEIDHADLDRGNNRITNLRQATRSENQRNKPTYRNNASGYKGVFWHKQHRKYIAQIQTHKKRVHLGLFRNIEDAANAYREASARLHGNFSRAA